MTSITDLFTKETRADNMFLFTGFFLNWISHYYCTEIIIIVIMNLYKLINLCIFSDKCLHTTKKQQIG